MKRFGKCKKIRANIRSWFGFYNIVLLYAPFIGRETMFRWGRFNLFYVMDLCINYKNTAPSVIQILRGLFLK